jgi:hypothetical protein
VNRDLARQVVVTWIDAQISDRQVAFQDQAFFCLCMAMPFYESAGLQAVQE